MTIWHSKCELLMEKLGGASVVKHCSSVIHIAKYCIFSSVAWKREHQMAGQLTITTQIFAI